MYGAGQADLYRGLDGRVYDLTFILSLQLEEELGRTI